LPGSEDGFFGFLFLVQLVGAPMTGLFFGLIGVELVDQLSGSRGHQFAGWLCYALVGLAEGFLTQTIFRRSAPSGGRFIWLPPVLVLLLFFLVGDGGSIHARREFLVLNPYSFVPGAASGLFTGLAVASCFYSLGNSLAHRRRSR
jgi:uncharacterized membrane protein YuzA (DUF378 family)